MPKKRAATRTHFSTPLLVFGGGIVAFLLMGVMVVGIGVVFLLGSSSILPGVSVGGVAVGGMSQSQAAAALESSWSQHGIRLRDGNRVFPVNPAQLGIELDAEASARAAARYGKSMSAIGDALRGMIGRADLSPVIRINTGVTEQALRELASQIEIAPVNAGIRVVNGSIVPRPSEIGRAIDMDGTLAPLRNNAAAALADGELELVMLPIQPLVTDSTALVAAASALLANPLQMRVYDPVRDETLFWNVMPETWADWLTVGDNNQLNVSDASLRAYLSDAQTELGTERYLNLDSTVQAVQNALLRGETATDIRVYHHDVTHVVQPGETIISIAYNYGIPYPYVQQANGVIESVSAGQTITLPSHDTMLPEPVIFGKRIVVSISGQWVRVYEHGNLKWDWVASTGISSSPTWPGIYQVISHEDNAYAANWDLWMPSFIGVYRPIPGSDFTNGFHGFPTRGGSQLLWTNSLGTRVTYGCILLSNENARALSEWAETGVVVEIQP